MKVKGIMNKKPICLKPNNTLKHTLRLLSKHRIGGCPVVNGRGKVVGIVAQSDILRLMDTHTKINTGDSLHLIFAVLKGEEFDVLKGTLKSMLSTRVKDFMNKDVTTVDEDEDVYTAARMINSKDIERLPVVKETKLLALSRAKIS